MNTNSLARRALLVSLTLSLFALARPAGASGGLAPDLGPARWGADYFPNVPLVAHDGRRLSFFDDLVEGKVVLVNFIYTSCPDACPLETAKIAEVQRLLGDRMGRDTFFYSISIDPDVDTPEVLADYARRYGAGPGWLFLTGKGADVALLRERLGLYADGETNLTQHTLSMIIGNQRTGRFMKCSPMENSHVIATQIGDWLHNWDRPRDPAKAYANAPELRPISRGESLFRTRCAACHFIAGEGLAGGPPIGPDLFGVTERRERAWLESWLRDPAAMLKAGDPIAVELYEKFNHVPMPDAKLGELEVNELLAFLADETRRVRETRPGFEADDGGREANAVPACCAKKASLTLGDAEPAAPRAAAAVRRPRFTPLSLGSIAAGLLLGIVAAALRRRSAGT